MAAKVAADMASLLDAVYMAWGRGDMMPVRAPVAQLDRAPDFESVGRRFESCRARQRRKELATEHDESSRKRP